MNFARFMVFYSCFRLYKCDVIRSKRDNAAFAKNFGGPLAAAEAPEDTSNETVGDAIFMLPPTQAPNPYAPTEAAVVTLDPPEMLGTVPGCETRVYRHQVPVFLLPMPPLPPPATRSSYLRYLALRRQRRSIEFANDGQTVINFEQSQQPVGPVAPPGTEDEETKLPTPPSFPLEMMQQVPERPPPAPLIADPQPLVVAASLPVPVATSQVLQPTATAVIPLLTPLDSRPAAYAQLPPSSQVQQQPAPPPPASQIEQPPPPVAQLPPAPPPPLAPPQVQQAVAPPQPVTVPLPPPAPAPQVNQQNAPQPVAQPPPSLSQQLASAPFPQPVSPQVQQMLAPPQPVPIPPPPPAPQIDQPSAPQSVAQPPPSLSPQLASPPFPQPAPPQVVLALPQSVPIPPPPAPQFYQQIAPPPPPPPPPISPLNAGPPPLSPLPPQNLNNGPPPAQIPPPIFSAPPPPPYGAPPSTPYGAPRPPPPYGAPPPFYAARPPPPYGAPPPPPPPPKPIPTLPPIDSFGVGTHVLVISIFCIHINDCIARCRAVQCNFIARNAVRFHTFLYKVHGSVLQTATYLPTPMWDSFALLCPEPEVQSGCIRFISVEDATVEFNNFIAKYEKTYKSADDRNEVFPTFKDNLQVIQLLNCRRMSETDASFDVTQFSDMTFTQFASESGGALLPIGDKNLKPDLAGRGQQLISKCPKYNWADFGVVPAPRNQKKCGSCYAFSTSDMISTQWHIDHRMSGSFELSPQFLVDCSVAPAGLGCQGGRPIEILKNLTRCDSSACNFPLEKCYPYTMVKGNCEPKCPGSPKISVYWATVVDARGPNEKETIAAMLHWGPVVAIVDANQAWQFYSGAGAIGPEQCSKMQNHAVLIVGYDFRGPTPYYIIKNSWGTKWGSKGYVKLEAGTNTCGVATNLVVCCTHNCDDFKSSGTFPIRINSRGCI